MPHVRKHHSPINEEEEIYDLVENGLVIWLGYKDEVTELFGRPDWACGDDITYRQADKYGGESGNEESLRVGGE